MEHENRVKFIQSNLDEVLTSPEVSLKEDFLKIDHLGMITVLVKDERRSGRRREDLHRTMQWQESEIRNCSSIR